LRSASAQFRVPDPHRSVCGSVVLFAGAEVSRSIPGSHLCSTERGSGRNAKRRRPRRKPWRPRSIRC